MVGIYKIINIKNGKVYIGKSKNINGRFRQHKRQLKNNKDSVHLQSAWNKYKEESFEFSILEECKMEELKEKEEYYINLYQSYDREKGYNIERYSNGNKDVSIETRDKLREKSKKNSYFIGRIFPQYGEKNGSSKLTLEQVKEIRCRYKNNCESHRKLAKEYNVGKTTITDILLNKTWLEDRC